MASRPLLSPLGEENILDPLSYERGGVNLALGRSSDTETGRILFTVGSVDRSIGRYRGRYSGR